MRTGADGLDRRLDGALARLAAEAGPGPALQARVLADAAMVGAERRPAAGQDTRSRRRRSGRGWLGGLLARPAYGFAGAGAAATVAIGIALGYGAFDDAPAPVRAELDADLLSALSPFDRLERDVMASLDEDLLDPDAPL